MPVVVRICDKEMTALYTNLLIRAGITTCGGTIMLRFRQSKCSISLAFVLVLTGFVLFAQGQICYAGTSTCDATLSSDFKLNVPVLSFAGTYYQVGLQYSPYSDGLIWFTLSDIVSTTQGDCGNSGTLALSSDKYVVHIPSLNLSGTSFWLDLEYAPTTDGLVWFKLTNYGISNCDFTSVPLVRELCFGGVGKGCEGAPGAPSDKKGNSCYVKGWMSVGSILHDRCCVATSNAGYNCNNPWWLIDTGDPMKCWDEWQEAWHDTADCTITHREPDHQWQFIFGPYPAGSKGDSTNADLRAPAGTRVTPKYQYVCSSGRCEIDAQCNTIIKYDGCGNYCECSSDENRLICPDIAGKWNFTNSGTVTCTGGGETDTEYPSGSGTVCISQNACNVSWRDPVFNQSRSGTVSGNTIQVSGIFAVPLVGDVNFTQNSYSASGTISEDTKTINLNGSGTASGSYEGIDFSCSGTDKATFTRSSLSSISSNMYVSTGEKTTEANPE